jgi:hypothetical protein
MKLKIRQQFLVLLKKDIGKLSVILEEKMRWSNPESMQDVDADRLTKAELEGLKKLAVKHNDTDTTANSLRLKIIAFEKLSADPTGSPVSTAEKLTMALIEYIKPLPKHWLFSEDNSGQLVPYYVSDIRYHEADVRNQTPARCVMSLQYAIRGEDSGTTQSWEYSDLHGGRTVSKILNDAGYYIETPELVAKYDEQMKRYNHVYPQTGEQFHAVGMAGSGGRFSYTSTSMENDGEPSKVVVDDLIKDDDGEQRKTGNRTGSNQFWLKQELKRKRLGVDVEEGEDAGDPELQEDSVLIPVHPYIKVFRLADHEFYHVHADNLLDYKWDTTLADKLVMTKEKKELVALLVESAGEVMEDIVKGKTGGIIVAATGVPGTGKTLTAEVYGEAVKRPLYVVQCSQLGTDEERVEKRLAKVLTRATRWKAILLIDECDVYVRARGTDIQQNAIVGVFLRTLERYRGILFLTTNRATEIDDAIISRLTAHVRYDMPDEDQLGDIWKILSVNYKIPLDERLLALLANEFKGNSGRTVKNLLKLARIVIKKEKCKPSIELFRRLATFQDLEAKK